LSAEIRGGVVTRALAALFVLALTTVVSTAVRGDDDVIWVDVRTPGEFAEGHVEGATNIPYTEIVERVGEVTSDKKATLYLYCRSGRRSGIARDALRRAGYENVINIGGLQEAYRLRPPAPSG
jgi:phage shock protein E